jgi:hypothetical protein
MTETIRGKIKEEIYESLDPKPMPVEGLKKFLMETLGYTATDASESLD